MNNGEIAVRVVVVGAGVIGLCCAYELRRRGHHVTLLDRGTPGGAASWGNAGWICPSLSGPIPAPGLRTIAAKWALERNSPLYFHPRPDPAFARWLWHFWRRCNADDYRAGLAAVASLSNRSFALFDALRHDGVQFEMHHRGLLFLFRTEGALQQSVRDLELMLDHGYRRAEVLRGDALLALVPPLSHEVIGGFLVGAERHVRPDSLTAGLTRRLRELGGDVQPETAVLGFERRGTTVTTVVTDAGAITADRFLIAAGVWSRDLTRRAGFEFPIEAGKGYSITIDNPTIRLDHPLYLGEARTGVSPFDDMLRVAGTMELAGIDTTLSRQRVDAMRRNVGRYLSGWEGGGPAAEWSGMRPITPDGLPVLGLVPNSANVYVATGHGMLGVTLAPASGVAIADLMHSGTTGVDLRPFDPARFSRQGALARSIGTHA